MSAPLGSGVLDRLVGDAPAFRAMLRDVRAVAPRDATVLLTGETGTGKELVARAIHALSARSGAPFVAANCGAIPDALLEDELFGHERGAFTDARAARTGLLAQANLGTLLLDEVDALTPRAQVALLRVLQDHTYRPLGANGERRSDVRFIASANTDLEPLVRAGVFRADLYYRLGVLTLRLPALRERRGDILLLAEHFLRVHRPPERPAVPLSDEAAHALCSWSWPGNVRELENAIVRALCRADREKIAAADLGLQPARPSLSHAPSALETNEWPATSRETERDGPDGGLAAVKREMVREFERAYLARLMAEHGGNVTHAARAAHKERRELAKLLKKYGFRAGAARNGARVVRADG